MPLCFSAVLAAWSRTYITGFNISLSWRWRFFNAMFYVPSGGRESGFSVVPDRNDLELALVTFFFQPFAQQGQKVLSWNLILWE